MLKFFEAVLPAPSLFVQEKAANSVSMCNSENSISRFVISSCVSSICLMIFCICPLLLSFNSLLFFPLTYRSSNVLPSLTRLQVVALLNGLVESGRDNLEIRAAQMAAASSLAFPAGEYISKVREKKDKRTQTANQVAER